MQRRVIRNVIALLVSHRSIALAVAIGCCHHHPAVAMNRQAVTVGHLGRVVKRFLLPRLPQQELATARLSTGDHRPVPPGVPGQVKDKTVILGPQPHGVLDLEVRPIQPVNRRNCDRTSGPLGFPSSTHQRPSPIMESQQPQTADILNPLVIVHLLQRHLTKTFSARQSKSSQHAEQVTGHHGFLVRMNRHRKHLGRMVRQLVQQCAVGRRPHANHSVAARSHQQFPVI